MTDAAVEPENKVVPALKAILGQKVGMTQIFDAAGNIIPVTVIVAGPCHVAQVLSTQSHGYEAIQVAFGDVREKNISKPRQGMFKKASIPAARWFRELRTPLAPQFQAGQSLRVDSFAVGDYVDVCGFSKGKGFAGAMKRHNFGGGPSTHGQSDRQRAPGSSGSNTYPGPCLRARNSPATSASSAPPFNIWKWSEWSRSKICCCFAAGCRAPKKAF